MLNSYNRSVKTLILSIAFPIKLFRNDNMEDKAFKT